MQPHYIQTNQNINLTESINEQHIVEKLESDNHLSGTYLRVVIVILHMLHFPEAFKD